MSEGCHWKGQSETGGALEGGGVRGGMGRGDELWATLEGGRGKGG